MVSHSFYKVGHQSYIRIQSPDHGVSSWDHLHHTTGSRRAYRVAKSLTFVQGIKREDIVVYVLLIFLSKAIVIDMFDRSKTFSNIGDSGLDRNPLLAQTIARDLDSIVNIKFAGVDDFGCHKTRMGRHIICGLDIPATSLHRILD